jgi:hypothetical protein
MHARRSKKPLLLASLLIASALVFGCELIVDFDRTKIPIEDSGIPEGSVPEGSTPDASDAGDASDGDAADAADSSDASDASDADGDAPDGD